MRAPSPIRPLVRHGLEYDAMMRRDLLKPVYAQIERAFLGADTWWDVMTRVATSENDLEWNETKIRADIAEMSRRIEAYHRARSRTLVQFVLIQTGEVDRRRAIGDEPVPMSVAIQRVMSEAEVFEWMREWRAINIDLIRTIPRRAHESLLERVQEALGRRPFSREALHEVLTANYRLTEYQTRRIARDQVNKAIGQLTEVRQRQVGISRYRWQSAGDQRVRPAHRQNDGREFAWNQPPATGHPGWAIQCRCTAIAIVDREAVDFTATKARANLPRPGLGFFSEADLRPPLPPNAVSTFLN